MSSCIELYERKNSLENFCSAMSLRPDRVIFITSTPAKTERQIEIYRRILEKRGCSTEFLCFAVTDGRAESVSSEIERIVEEDGDCRIDLTGGDDFFLFAAGMICGRSGRRIGFHRFDILSHRLFDYTADGIRVSDVDLSLTVEENTMLYGGMVVSCDRPQFTEKECAELECLWDICRADASKWNRVVSAVALIESHGKLTTVSGGMPRICCNELPKIKNQTFSELRSLCRKLHTAGMLAEYEITNTSVSLTYASRNVRMCLTNVGRLLEQTVYLSAKKSRDADGKAAYGDVAVNTVLDWDGKAAERGTDTSNEIDVMMMQGAVPIFVSCKNGGTDVNELFKLCEVAAKFGGSYARKVLVIGSLGRDANFADNLRQRACDLGVTMIEEIHSLNAADIISRIAAIGDKPGNDIRFAG